MAFPVLEREVALDGGARAEVVDDLHLAVEIGVLRLGLLDRFHTSAEVWGTTSTGELVPVCWISHIDGSFTLSLDARWIALAGARAPFELREVRVQDPATDVVLDRVARMPIDVGALPAAASRRIRAVEPDMLTGGSLPEKPAIGLAPSLMLVHGYCSGGSVWPAADFTQPNRLPRPEREPHARRVRAVDRAAGARPGSLRSAWSRTARAAARHSTSSPTTRAGSTSRGTGGRSRASRLRTRGRRSRRSASLRAGSTTT
jgi:hypothetical protein